MYYYQHATGGTIAEGQLPACWCSGIEKCIERRKHCESVRLFARLSTELEIIHVGTLGPLRFRLPTMPCTWFSTNYPPEDE